MTTEQRAEEWNLINKAINKTKTVQVPDNRGKQKFVPFTKQTNFGTLKVIDQAPVPAATTRPTQAAPPATPSPNQTGH